MSVLEAADSGYAVVTRDLTKCLGDRAVVDHVDLAVPIGGCYALTGGNGAGKTCLARMVAGAVRPTHGDIEIFDEPVGGPVMSEVGFTADLAADVTATDALRAGDSADPATRERRVDRALSRTGLAARARVPVRDYSAGEYRRLMLAAALVRPCALLLVDDPFDGLDASSTAELHALCAELCRDGITLLLTVRSYAQVNRLATHVGVLDGGRLVAQGTRAELVAGAPRPVTVHTSDLVLTLGTLRGLGVTDLRTGAGTVTGRLGGLSPDRVARALVSAGVRVTGLEIAPPDFPEIVPAGSVGDGHNSQR